MLLSYNGSECDPFAVTLTAALACTKTSLSCTAKEMDKTCFHASKLQLQKFASSFFGMS